MGREPAWCERVTQETPPRTVPPVGFSTEPFAWEPSYRCLADPLGRASGIQGSGGLECLLCEGPEFLHHFLNILNHLKNTLSLLNHSKYHLEVTVCRLGSSGTAAAGP